MSLFWGKELHPPLLTLDRLSTSAENKNSQIYVILTLVAIEVP